MHEHTDKPCKHDLRVCTDCGNVYCAKCKKEWFKTQYYSYPITYTYYGDATLRNPAGTTISDTAGISYDCYPNPFVSATAGNLGSHTHTEQD